MNRPTVIRSRSTAACCTMSVPRLLLAVCLLLSSAVAAEKSPYDLFMEQLRPQLPPLLQGIVDEFKADPVIRGLDPSQWQRVERAVAVLMRNRTFRAVIEAEAAARKEEPSPRYTFPCGPLRRNGTARTVHELSPADIAAVASMGDSLTAANGAGASSPLGVLLQYRGLAWSAGGDGTFASNPMLPNILRQYNEAVWGYSTGICRSKGRCSGMNRAVPGTTARDMSAQAREVVEKMRSSAIIDFKNDWKMVTIFIGNNDICNKACLYPDLYSVEIFSRRVRDALDILYKELPRTFVNLVLPVDAYECSNLNIGFICTALHLVECPCAAFPPFYKWSKALNEAYQRELRVIADSSDYSGRSDFTVVVQPFFENTLLPNTTDGSVDLSYFAPDCFHLSAKGQAEAAKALWNNMLEPVGKKKTSWVQGEPYECPNPERPYFYTRLNSN